MEAEREDNLRLIQEKERLQKERSEMEHKINIEKSSTEELREENAELEQKRQNMVQEYERLQD